MEAQKPWITKTLLNGENYAEVTPCLTSYYSANKNSMPYRKKRH